MKVSLIFIAVLLAFTTTLADEAGKRPRPRPVPRPGPPPGPPPSPPHRPPTPKTTTTKKPVHRPPPKKTTTTTTKKPSTTRKTTRKPSQKPETCEAAIRGCAVAYESDDCTSGWKLPVGEVTWLHIDFFAGNYILACCSFAGRDEIQGVHKYLQVQVSCHFPPICVPKTQKREIKTM